MNSLHYIALLRNHLEKDGERIAGPNFIFQQDNAPVHVSKVVKEYLSQKNINNLAWPARSPDLNIIENFWGSLSRLVYDRSRQYGKISKLKKALIERWNELNQTVIQNLFRSLPSRIVAVLENRGGSTKY